MNETELKQRWRHAHALAGLCRWCSQLAVDGKTLCKKHLAMQREASARYGKSVKGKRKFRSHYRRVSLASGRRVNACGWCGELGHSRKTCKDLLRIIEANP